MSTEASDGELWDLENLREARNLGDWMFAQVRPYVRGRVAEVGAGIGTHSERLLAAGIIELLAIEPEAACLPRLRATVGADPRATVVAETLPDAPALRARAGTLDFVLCQNVLEHIADDRAAVRAMAEALRPGGHLTILVPAHPRLYGPLDDKYGHERRYTRERLRDVVDAAGLRVEDLYSFNALGVAGWLTKSRLSGDPRLDARSLRIYERLVPVWRAVEERVRLPFGLSLIAHAARG